MTFLYRGFIEVNFKNDINTQGLATRTSSSNGNIKHPMFLLRDHWIKVHHDCDIIPDAIREKLMKAIDIQPTRPTNILSTRVSEVI